ncbi:hypothetical protein [Erythrobacter aureus]|uniref:hypothetical protein n=1 Tax=Erythrobacter aureus TaxID=2182384 RepID=UPI0013B3F2FA|nr:hypothetical protein [Erythrobacter aureus]
MRSSAKSRRKKSKTSRSLKIGIAATFLTFSGAAAGMFMDGVSETILTFREKQATPPASPIPESAQAHQMPQASIEPIQHAPEPEPVWFPANNAAEWGISIRPGQQTIPVSIGNTESMQNGIVRFYIATGSRSAPWRPAATVHVRAGSSASIRLPQGQYLVARTAAPTTLDYREAASRKPDESTQLTVGPNPGAPIQIAIDRTGSIPIQNASSPHRYALASSQRSGSTTAASRSRALQPVRSTATVTSGREQEEYAGLVEASLNET